MANFIGRLGVLLGLDSAEFQKGLAQASRQLDTFVEQARTTAAVGATAFAAMAYQAMKLADEIVDTAKANDIAVDSVLKLRNALAMSGGEAENAGKLLSSFTANIDKAAEGSFEVQKTLKGLGVSLQDLRTMSIDDLLTKSLDGLAKMEDPLTRNAKAMELFGKAAKGVDFASLNQEIANGAGVTDAQAKAIEDAAAAYDTITQAGRDFTVMLAAEIGPSIKVTIDYIKTLSAETSVMGGVFRVVFETIVILGANVAHVVEAIADSIMHMVDTLKLLAQFRISDAFDLDDAHFAKWDKRRAQLEEFERMLLSREMAKPGGGYGGGTSNFDDPRRSDRPAAGGGAPKRAVKAGVDKAAEEAKKKAAEEAKKQLDLFLKGFAEEQRQIEENNRLLAEQEKMYQKGNAAQVERQSLAAREIDRNKEMLELVFQGRNMRGEDLQLAQELKEIEWKRLDAIVAINANEALDREARAEALKRENDLAEKAVELAKRRNELTKQTREGTMTEGFFKAMQDAARNASTEFERGQQMFQSVMGNMESAIDSFVQTGKFKFKDFAASVIRDLIAIQMKAQAIALINMGLKALGFGGLSLPGKAAGGPVSGGSPYIVGERGPELFVPSGSGAIVPNHRLADSMGSSQPQVVYNGPYIANMSAIDTQSGMQFLMQNKQSIWAANQSAQRSLPVSK
jgi:lambda family phage tail tape measure protein